jgi:hypothetical protein
MRDLQASSPSDKGFPLSVPEGFVGTKFTAVGKLLFLALITGSCSEYSKTPVEDLSSLREHARAEVEKGPVQPQVVRETVVVEKPKVVIQEQARIDDSFLVIETDDVLSFTEGIKGQYIIKVHHLSEKLQSDLTVIQGPKGLSVKKIKDEKNVSVYSVEWSPELYQIPTGKVFESSLLELQVKARSQDPLLSKIQKQKKITVLLTKPDMLPQNLKIQSLPEKIKRGQTLRFQVTVEIPFLNDQSSEKPVLVISPDPMIYTPGVESEKDGSRLVRLAPGKSLEYIGHHQWRFDLVLDTKDLLPTGTGPHRFLVKVFSPTGLATPTQLVRFQIEEAL